MKKNIYKNNNFTEQSQNFKSNHMLMQKILNLNKERIKSVLFFTCPKGRLSNL